MAADSLTLISVLLDWLQLVVANLHLEPFLDFLDVHYARFMLWLWYPTLLSIALPVLLVLMIYLTAVFFTIYKSRHGLVDGVYTGPLWMRARRLAASCWSAHARVWNGFELHGFERVPRSGPALLISYHGSVPTDIYYLVAECIRVCDRHPRVVGDNFLFRIPGWSRMLHVLGVTPGTVTSCCESLAAGNLLIIMPGGLREALFGGPNYELLWGARRGFAKVAQMSGVPVFPVFTQNGREAFKMMECGHKLWKRLYEKTRLPLIPVYGNFPVKMRMYIGKPLTFDDKDSVEDITSQVREAVQALIRKHQRLPGSVLHALADRLPPLRPFL